MQATSTRASSRPPALCGAGVLLLLAAAGAAAAQDLTELSLDDLMEIEVTSVSRRAEPLGRAAAAIHVVSGEEIRRVGARNIAEALRLVPGMDVARSNSNNYAISARGFQNTGDKLQVLVDGRSVYTPLTSAVFWDVLDTDLASIDRIEVIRGPGATLWGANAVNGVVNVITRPASTLQGGEAQLAAGNEERAGAFLRAGGEAGGGHLRFYGKAYERDRAATADGGDAVDGQRLAQGGLRGDWDLGNSQQLAVSSDFYSARSRAQGATAPEVEQALRGANLSARWSLLTDEANTLVASFYFDHYLRDIPQVFSETRDTYDLQLQHGLDLGDRHRLTYGAGYRQSRDDTGGPPRVFLFLPASRDIETLSAFVQDQIRFGPDWVWTLGSKFERNDFSGYEFQPGTRLGWAISEGWFSWSAISRAVRTPNRIDHDFALYCPPPDGFPGFCGPDTVVPVGSRGFESEKLTAYEWGLRYASGTRWSADLATFYNDYDDLRSAEVNGGMISLQNRLRGRGLGAELSLAWTPKATVDLLFSYSFLDLEAEAEPGSADASSAAIIEGGSPRHQAGLRLYTRPAARWTADGFLRYVGRLQRTADPGAGNQDTSVPAYTELNLRLAYRPGRQLEVALIGENLLHARHAEYGSAALRSELERSVQLALNWSWP